MKRSSRRLVALLAGLVAAILIVVALDSNAIYSPGAGHLYRFLYVRFAVLRGFDTPLGFMTIDEILRKCYALAAFALVGVLAAPLVRRRRKLATALVVSAFSAAIEVLQKISGSRESFGSNVFDVLSGTLGGVLGAMLYDALAALARRFARTDR